MSVKAGLRTATDMATWDFETYSEAGYVWSPQRNRWVAPPGAPSGRSKGLPLVGVRVYAQHPTADVLMVSYDLRDGAGVRQWFPPTEPVPADLRAHIEGGRLIEAHNAAFEYALTKEVLEPKYDFPTLRLEQLYCSAAKARAWMLPPSLAGAGEALHVPGNAAKDKDGKRLIGVFSCPHNPTKKQPARRITPEMEPEDWDKYCAYNRQDVVAEHAISQRMPDLTVAEREYYLVDRAINNRGVHIDMKAVNGAIQIIEAAHERYNARLRELTGGAVESASKAKDLLAWLREQEVHLNDLRDETVRAALMSPQVLGPVREALLIRSQLASASVKKVYAMKLHASRGDRMRDLFTFHGARSGRPTGSGPQPTNLPNHGPWSHHCTQCGTWFADLLPECPTCKTPAAGMPQIEWCEEAQEAAIAAISTGSLEVVEMMWGDALAAVSGSIRGMHNAAPGCDLICSDYSAIEAVVNACLSGEQWRIDTFRGHGKIYEASAASMFHVPLEEILEYKELHGHHHPLRKRGKVAELACLAGDTQVLTNHGYKNIVSVTLDDKLWDGSAWVSHAGVINRGTKRTVALDGTRMTPDHKIFCGGSWREARQLASSERGLYRALATASESLSFGGSHGVGQIGTANVNALVATSHVRWLVTCCQASLRGAESALALPRQKPVGASSRHRLMMLQNDAFTLGSTRRFTDATILKTPDTPTMAAGAFRCTLLGGKTVGYSLSTSSRCPAGTGPASIWIGSTTAWATSRVICGSSLAARTTRTSGRSKALSLRLPDCEPVYDILNVGLRNRFTIKTDHGHLIVHNCGYLGWIGALRAMGYDEPDEQAKELILAWREASPAIEYLGGGQKVPFYKMGQNPVFGGRQARTDFRYGLEGLCVEAIQQPGRLFPVNRLDGSYSGLSWLCRDNVLYLLLPDGTYVAYHNPSLEPAEQAWRGLAIHFDGYNTNPKKGPRGWIRMSLYAGIMLENACQAVANRILRYGQVNLEKAGYPIVMHVYDENIAEVPEGFGSVEEFERIMGEMPVWARTPDGQPWPIRAHGGWRAKRYRK